MPEQGNNMAVILNNQGRRFIHLRSSSLVIRDVQSMEWLRVKAALDCVVRPELTIGPYFVDEQLNRSDIRSDPLGGSTRAFRIRDLIPLDSSSCAGTN